MADHSNVLIIERLFDAPRELVWRAWTEPEHLMRWWGPQTFTAPTCQIDLRVDGKYLFCMQAPDGQQYWSTGVYKEIVPPERLVCTDSFADEAGNIVPATYYGMSADYPLETEVTVTFEEVDGKTKMTLRHAGLPAAEKSAASGWNESFDKLAASLHGISVPDPALKRLDRLVGTWAVSGEAQGQLTYEWMDGGFFLMQQVDLEQGGQKNTGLEIIGREWAFGADQPSVDITSRFYGSTGVTFDYVYELEGDTLTIWGGEKGSPAVYRGTFSDDGNTLAGAWTWPGGGYSSTARRR